MARISTRTAKEALAAPRFFTGDDTGAYLQDAARTPDGHATKVAIPEHEGHIAWLLQQHEPLLVIGAQSSLTGGATPFGETVVLTEKFQGFEAIGDGLFRVGAGMPLMTLQQQLREQGRFYPPVPTYDGAFLGGSLATNAAGAKTFKYGVTRDWIEGMTVALANGEFLDLRRGEVIASDGQFEIQCANELITVPVPEYRPPNVSKCSAGYFSADDMDLVDLFIGSEGTLGLVTEIVINTVPLDFQELSAFLTLTSEAEALDFTREIREAGKAKDNPLNVSAIESIDGRSLELLREDGADKDCSVDLPEDRPYGLFLCIELPIEFDEDKVMEDFGEFFEDPEAEASDSSPIKAFCRILNNYPGSDEHIELAMPGDRTRAEQLFHVRDRVPTCINHIIAAAQRDVDPRISKTAADMVVRFEHLGKSFELYREVAKKYNLDMAIWGHVSDGNVHPNFIPTSYEDLERGKQAIFELGQQIIALGGSPLAEHGVGRHPMKQALLKSLYGESGIEEMRTIKRRLDPHFKLAPNVLFPVDTANN